MLFEKLCKDDGFDGLVAVIAKVVHRLAKNVRSTQNV